MFNKFFQDRARAKASMRVEQLGQCAQQARPPKQVAVSDYKATFANELAHMSALTDRHETAVMVQSIRKPLHKCA